ncbi:hypothetical protein Tco_0447391, partial [Tanacetum coccineum]
MLFEEERRYRIEGEERPPSPSQSAEKTTRLKDIEASRTGRKEGKEDHAFFFGKRKMKADSKIL